MENKENRTLIDRQCFTNIKFYQNKIRFYSILY